MFGRCPNCESTGAVGSPCGSPTCTARRLHLVPIPDAERQRSAAIPEPLVGTFVGEFLVTRLLDKGGGFGRILLGLQRPLFELQGAIKLLDLGRQEAHLRTIVLEKFENEARVLARVRHANVVRLLQYGRLSDETPFLVMEYVPGARTLATEIGLRAHRGDRLEIPALRRIVDQLARALDGVHRLGLIHRDLKPDNIMLEELDGDPWHVKLVDFGLAKSIFESSETRFVTGTRGYMAPEQLDRKNLGPATDLYAFALIVLELWCGRRLTPVGLSDLRNGRQSLETAFDPTTRLASLQLSSLERRLFLRALALDPAERFPTAAAFALAFDDVVTSGESTMIRRGDLSALVDPEETSRLKREAARLESERLALAAEVERLRRENHRISTSPVFRTEGPARRWSRPLVLGIGAVVALGVGFAAYAITAGRTVESEAEASVLASPLARTVAPHEAPDPALQITRPPEADVVSEVHSETEVVSEAQPRAEVADVTEVTSEAAAQPGSDVSLVVAPPVIEAAPVVVTPSDRIADKPKKSGTRIDNAAGGKAAKDPATRPPETTPSQPQGNGWEDTRVPLPDLNNDRARAPGSQ